MKVVYKYAVHGVGFEIGLSMPSGAYIVHVGEQQGNVNLWAEVEQDSAHHELRYFQIFGTGYPIPENGYSHLGTVVMQDGYVWHVYEIHKG